MSAKARSIWVCQSCGANAPRWVGKCNECGEYGTYVEEFGESSTQSNVRVTPAAELVSLQTAGEHEAIRIVSTIDEFDRVLGGGVVKGSLVLIGGEPGIGKSTLLLQAASALADQERSVLYVCGEESPQQIGLRAHRLGLQSDNVSLLPEIKAAVIEATALACKPDVLIVDSIQTMYDEDSTGTSGSVAQIRSCTARLMRLAKEHDITTIVVGHVTKDGSLAGPRVLEHMVDTVLYFEGDKDHTYRIVRAVKNRFGSISEIGIFEMTAKGLIGVASPSEAFLDQRTPLVSGSMLFAATEGSRPLIVEIQALVTPSYLPAPRRLANGIDTVRLHQIIAVLERRAGVSFASTDVIVSVAGGIKLSEPALDLPLAMALISAQKDTPLTQECVAFGEVALTGRVRKVSRSDARRKEAAALGIPKVVSADEISSIEECLALF